MSKLGDYDHYHTLATQIQSHGVHLSYLQLLLFLSQFFHVAMLSYISREIQYDNASDKHNGSIP